jgi:hypothetical protein
MVRATVGSVLLRPPGMGAARRIQCRPRRESPSQILINTARLQPKTCCVLGCVLKDACRHVRLAIVRCSFCRRCTDRSNYFLLLSNTTTVLPARHNSRLTAAAHPRQRIADGERTDVESVAGTPVECLQHSANLWDYTWLEVRLAKAVLLLYRSGLPVSHTASQTARADCTAAGYRKSIRSRIDSSMGQN